MKKKYKKLLLLGIPVVLLVLAMILYVPLKQTALDDTYPYVRQQFPLIQDYPFNTEGLSKIILSDKIELSRLQTALITVRGCRLESAESNGKLTIEGKDYELNFQDCDFLTYPDQGGQSPYVHYQTLTIPLPIPEKYNLDVNMDLAQSLDVIEGKLTVSSLVECTRDAHCPEVANQCDVGGSYKCLLDNNKPVPTPEYKKSNLNVYLIVALVLVSLVALYYYRKKK